MALNKQKFTVKFDKGVDTGTDSKTVIPSKFTKMDNMEWTKNSSVRQRPGYEKQTLSPLGNISTLFGCRQLHALGAELLLEAASGFVAYSQGCIASKDTPSGFTSAAFIYPKPLERARVDVLDITASNTTQVSPDATAANPSGTECWVWTEAALYNGNACAFYRIIDGATRSILQEGSLNDALGLQSYNPRVIVRNVAGASRFYIYYQTWDGGVVSALCMRYIDVASGQTKPSALSAEATIATMTRFSVPFDAWYEPNSDKIIFAYENTTGDLVTLILTGSNGTGVLVTNTQVKTQLLDISVTATYQLGVATAVVSYIDAALGVTPVSIFSMLMTGASPLNTVVTSGAQSNATRVSSVWSNFDYLMVFFNTSSTGLPDRFNNNIGYVLCDPDGSNPTVQSLFARGVSLASRPCEYVNPRADELIYRYCVGAVLRSDVQPTFFLLSAGHYSNLISGYGTLADQKHSSPRVLARLPPGKCCNPYGGTVASAAAEFFRLPTNMPVI